MYFELWWKRTQPDDVCIELSQSLGIAGVVLPGIMLIGTVGRISRYRLTKLDFARI